jgi:P27 family predicted phage terminase small subunit
VPAAPSSLKQSGKRTWKLMWENGRAWLGPSDEIVVRLACEQVDELVSLRRSAAQLKHPELRLKYLRAVQESEKALLQTVSALGFTPTARAKLGLVVAQAAETQTRLGRFTGRPGRPPSA